MRKAATILKNELHDKTPFLPCLIRNGALFPFSSGFFVILYFGSGFIKDKSIPNARSQVCISLRWRYAKGEQSIFSSNAQNIRRGLDSDYLIIDSKHTSSKQAIRDDAGDST